MSEEEIIAALATVVWCMRSLHDPEFLENVEVAGATGRAEAMQAANVEDVAQIYRFAKGHITRLPR